jgi:ABC-type multidrug transport system ATPase subunit
LQKFVEEVMELVELVPLRNALVGLPGQSGLSTEQRKRLTIAVELVANPSIIFMDEPTSGLDARAAAIVMRTVRNTVNTGRTVVCTIHQPSIEIFEAFDEVQRAPPTHPLFGPMALFITFKHVFSLGNFLHCDDNKKLRKNK